MKKNTRAVYLRRSSFCDSISRRNIADDAEYDDKDVDKEGNCKEGFNIKGNRWDDIYEERNEYEVRMFDDKDITGTAGGWCYLSSIVRYYVYLSAAWIEARSSGARIGSLSKSSICTPSIIISFPSSPNHRLSSVTLLSSSIYSYSISGRLVKLCARILSWVGSVNVELIFANVYPL